MTTTTFNNSTRKSGKNLGRQLESSQIELSDLNWGDIYDDIIDFEYTTNYLQTI